MPATPGRVDLNETALVELETERYTNKQLHFLFFLSIFLGFIKRLLLTRCHFCAKGTKAFSLRASARSLAFYHRRIGMTFRWNQQINTNFIYFTLSVTESCSRGSWWCRLEWSHQLLTFTSITKQQGVPQFTWLTFEKQLIRRSSCLTTCEEYWVFYEPGWFVWLCLHV